MIIQQNPISVPATAALGKYLRVKYDSTNGLAAAGANDRELGTLAREHMLSLETKLDIVEGAIDAIDRRTRAVLDKPPPVSEPHDD